MGGQRVEGRGLPPPVGLARRRPLLVPRARQRAGRALPEYRAIRVTGTILDAIADPDLSTEITLQPWRRYGVDGVILFSDILTPLPAMGVEFEISEAALKRQGCLGSHLACRPSGA